MKALMVTLLASFALGADAASQYPTVAYGDEVEISTDQTDDSVVTVAGKLKVSGGASAQSAGTRISLGSPADESDSPKTPAVIEVTGGTFGNGHSGSDVQLELGKVGGRGGVCAKGGEFAVARFNIDANVATNDSGFVDFLRIDGGRATLRETYNYSVNTARVVFAGEKSVYATAHGWYGTLFQGGPYLVESVNGTPIKFDIGNTYKNFNAAGTSVRVLGVADVSFSFGGDCYTEFWTGASFENEGTVSFSGSSDLNIQASGLFAECVRAVEISNSARLRLAQDTETTVQSFTTDASSSLCGAGMLVLRPSSDEDVASVFSGKIDPSSTLTLAKRGVGMSTVTVTSGIIPNLKLEEGALVLDSDCMVSNLTAEAGTTLIADGCTVMIVGTIPTGVSCVGRNGGRIKSVVAADGGALNEMRRSIWPVNVDLVKTGAGELRLYDPDLAGSVHVAGGTLSFSRLGLRDRYLKFTIKEILPFWDYVTGKDCPLDGLRARVFFYDTDDVCCTDAESYNTRFVLGTHPSALTKGEVTAPIDTVWTTMGDYTEPFFMFRSAGGNPCKWLTGVLTNAEDKVNFQVICYRLPDPISAAIDGINVDTLYGHGNPKWWTIESSATGEDGTWQTVLDKNERCAGMNRNGSGPLNNDSTKPAYHFSYVQQGVQGLADALQVQVDADATLDFSAKDGGQAVDAVTIDFEKGGGVLKGAKLAASGTLYLVHATKELLKVPLPLVLEDLGDAVNLENWNLVVDGVPKDRCLKYNAESGKVSIVPNGLMLLVR